MKLTTSSIKKIAVTALTTTALATVALFHISVTANGDPVDGGADLYKAKCQACHSADGSGNTPAGQKMGARDLRLPEVQKQSDAKLHAIIKDGKAKMPKFASLSDDQINGLVAHIRALAH